MSKVIVKYISGETKTGTILSFNVNQPIFYLQIENEAGKGASSPERMDSIREIRFLKKEGPTGSLVHRETIDQSLFAGTMAFKLTVEFDDGSVLTGTTIKYDPNDRGFYLIPLNPGDRSERIFVNAHAVKRVDSVKLLGKILVDQRKISREQLEAGLQRQKECREQPIGAILQERNLISDEQLQESLKKQKTNQKLIGEILLEAAYITREQLDHALRVQHEQRKKKLGQILVDLKFLAPNDICIALATQFNCAWIDLSEVTIPPEIVNHLPEETVKRLEVIPVEKKGKDVIVVATSQPQNPIVGADVRNATPLTVELAVAYEVDIARCIALHFPEKPATLPQSA